MRIPQLSEYVVTSPEEEVYISDHKLERPPLMLLTDRAKTKYIKYVERLIRTSYEYKEYINYLKEVFEMEFCSVFNNLTKESIKKLRIEIHHEPFTLYDIVNVVLRRFINMNKEIEEYSLADEVLKIHFKGWVGLIPLSLTVHQLVHNGSVFIPLQYIQSGYKDFYKEYSKEINECSLVSVLEQKISLSKTFDFDSNTSLKKKYIYLTNLDNVPDEL